MKTIIVILSLFITTLLMGAEVDHVALTLQTNGEIILNRADESMPINTGELLIDKDELESMEESYAAVKFVDGSSVLRLFPLSVLQINAEKNEDELDKRSFLEVGTVWSKVTKKTGLFEVETPTTVISVRGTEILLEVDDQGNTRLYTFSGESVMRNKVDGLEATVQKGQTSFSTGVGMIDVTDINRDELPDEYHGYYDGTETPGTIEIELKNDQGETRTIRIQLQ